MIPFDADVARSMSELSHLGFVFDLVRWATQRGDRSIVAFPPAAERERLKQALAALGYETSVPDGYSANALEVRW